jgi:phage recombination protein Bet
MSNFKTPTGIVLAPAQNQVIDFVDDAGTKIQISQQDVYQYICDKATPQEVVFFMELCRSQRLNPFKREAFLVKYGSSPASMITAEVVFERRANAHPSYTGMEHGVVYLDANGNICKREGTATYKAAGEVLIGGWARVHRNDRSDSYAEVSMDEYNKNQSVWKTMPGAMIDKCARAFALRLAFPSDFQGMYISEEMGTAPNVTEVHAEVMPDMPTDAPESQQEPVSGPVYPSKEQVDEFNNIVAELAAVRDKEAGEVTLAVLKSKALASTGYAMGTDMTADQMDVAIRLVQTWLAKAYQDEPSYEE